MVNGSGIPWTFSPCSKQITFMDITISIENGKLITKLFKKPLALQLYIPPHSCHPPGVITGLIIGNVLWIFCLCSKPQDTTKELCSFFNAILDRGYQYTSIQPIFEWAIDNATSYLTHTNEYREQLKQKKCRISHRRIFLHLPYHPNNPSSHTIQHLWHQTVFQSPGALPINHLTNSDGELIPIDQMVIAYSRAPNIGNLLSYCKLCQCSGPKVSSFL